MASTIGTGPIKYIRLQVDDHTIVEFLNGSRACSCGLERGETPNLRRLDMEEQIKAQIHRYFVARYGEDYVYKAPETFDNLLEQWMAAVARGSMEFADELMTRIENYWEVLQ